MAVVRAGRIDWDYCMRTVLTASLPKEAVGASLVVKAYFDRWPYEELQFRGMKSFACLNRRATAKRDCRTKRSATLSRDCR